MRKAFLLMFQPCQVIKILHDLFLQDQWFWRVRDNSVVPGYPMPINHFWQGLPPKIDAVYENSEGKFVFFKGNINYIFRN